eukprot:5520244-Pleurochrysis_carterae.AAC.2
MDSSWTALFYLRCHAQNNQCVQRLVICIDKVYKNLEITKTNYNVGINDTDILHGVSSDYAHPKSEGLDGRDVGSVRAGAGEARCGCVDATWGGGEQLVPSHVDGRAAGGSVTASLV